MASHDPIEHVEWLYPFLPSGQLPTGLLEILCLQHCTHIEKASQILSGVKDGKITFKAFEPTTYRRLKGKFVWFGVDVAAAESSILKTYCERSPATRQHRYGGVVFRLSSDYSTSLLNLSKRALHTAVIKSEFAQRIELLQSVDAEADKKWANEDASHPVYYRKEKNKWNWRFCVLQKDNSNHYTAGHRKFPKQWEHLEFAIAGDFVIEVKHVTVDMILHPSTHSINPDGIDNCVPSMNDKDDPCKKRTYRRLYWYPCNRKFKGQLETLMTKSEKIAALVGVYFDATSDDISWGTFFANDVNIRRRKNPNESVSSRSIDGDASEARDRASRLGVPLKAGGDADYKDSGDKSGLESRKGNGNGEGKERESQTERADGADV